MGARCGQKPPRNAATGSGSGCGEVFVLAAAEAVPGHDDAAAEAVLAVIQRGEIGAGAGVQQRPGGGAAEGVEFGADARPVEGGDHARFLGQQRALARRAPPPTAGAARRGHVLRPARLRHVLHPARLRHVLHPARLRHACVPRPRAIGTSCISAPSVRPASHAPSARPGSRAPSACPGPARLRHACAPRAFGTPCAPRAFGTPCAPRAFGTTRWQGTSSATGFAAQARPTARAAPGRPMRAATWP